MMTMMMLLILMMAPLSLMCPMDWGDRYNPYHRLQRLLLPHDYSQSLLLPRAPIGALAPRQCLHVLTRRTMRR